MRRRGLLAGALLLGLAFVYRPLLGGELILGRDVFRTFAPDAVLLLQSLEEGRLPLWNPYLRLGQPFAATLQSQAFYPPRLLCVLLAGPYAGLTLEQLLHAGLAAAGVYLLCRRLRATPLASALGGAAFGLSPLLTDLATQGNVVGSAAWSGFLLASALGVARRPGVDRVAGLAGFGALSFLAGSPETLLWQGLLAGALAAAVGRVRGALATAGGLLGALAVAGVASIPAIELTLHSSRGGVREDLLDWSASLPQLLAMAWPRADHPRGPYWGTDQWFVVTLFLGTLVCALALASLRRSPRVLPLALGGLALAVLSLGANLPPSAWLLRLPPFVLFRYPAKYLVGTAFCIAVLAALGLERVVALARRVRPRPLYAAGVALAALVSLALLAAVTEAPVLRRGIREGLPWVVLVSAAAMALLLALPGGSRRPARLRAGLALLACAELALFHVLQVGFGWERPRRFTEPSRLTAALPRPLDGRISLPVEDGLTDEGGAKPDYIDQSRDLLVPNRSVEERLPALEGYGAPEPARNAAFIMAGQRGIFDLAGVRYYVRDGPPPYADLERLPTPPGLPSIYRSNTAFPRAFVVQRAVVVPDAEALRQVLDPARPARTTAFLAEGEPLDAPPCEGSRAEVVRERLDGIELAVESCGEGYLVLTDAYYPGWRAEVDGVAAPIRRADYGLRAVRLGPGRHRVVFHYRPASFLVGSTLTGLSLAAMAIAWLRRRGRSAQARRAQQTSDTAPPTAKLAGR